MELYEAYLDYLRDFNSWPALAETLESRDLPLEAKCLSDFASLGPNAMPFKGSMLWLGNELPEGAGIGDLWFDAGEVSLYILLGPEDKSHEFWMALKPVRNFQIKAFLAFIKHSDQSLLPFRDILRKDRPDLLEYTPALKEEAELYCRFMGKDLPRWEEWHELRPKLLDKLWKHEHWEWIADKVQNSEVCHVALSRSSLKEVKDISMIEAAHLFTKESTRRKGLTFRPKVDPTKGLTYPSLESPLIRSGITLKKSLHSF